MLSPIHVSVFNALPIDYRAPLRGYESRRAARVFSAFIPVYSSIGSLQLLCTSPLRQSISNVAARQLYEAGRECDTLRGRCLNYSVASWYKCITQECIQDSANLRHPIYVVHARQLLGLGNASPNPKMHYLGYIHREISSI